MAHRTLELDLSQQQLLIFFAHLFVSLDSQDLSQEGPSLETVTHIGSSIFAYYRQGGPRRRLTLTMAEAHALKLVLRSLEQCSGQNPPSAHRQRALRDLMMGQALLQRAKRHPGRTSKEGSNR
jgi:hypothetical protein